MFLFFAERCLKKEENLTIFSKTISGALPPFCLGKNSPTLRDSHQESSLRSRHEILMDKK